MDDQQSSKKIWIIIAVALILIAVSFGAYFFLSKGSGASAGVKSFGSLFGQTGNDVPRTQTEIKPGNSINQNDVNNTASGESLFNQLTTVQVAGATAITKNGKSFVRYVERDNGFVYDVDPVTREATQLTNTTVPKIYEAYWVNSGASVVLRYLSYNQIARRDIIKTYLANIVLPIGDASSTDILGSLKGDFLPDDIAAVSVSQDGKHLFYLLPVADGISGTLLDVRTKVAKEVFRNSFSEWLPQLLNSGNIILTTKPSADVPGYAYLYNPLDRSLSRIVREKQGLTTLATANGSRILYSENVSRNTTLSLYDKIGFTQDEGEITHTAPIQLATLPEKCAWAHNHTRVYCGAFSSSPQAMIPDDWYQGTLAFHDTFWTINTDSTELTFLADPQIEVSKSFDVFAPFIDNNEDHFFFVDKNDSTLWSMRLIKDKFMTPEETALTGSTTSELSPEEMKDAKGSAPTATGTIKSVKKQK